MESRTLSGTDLVVSRIVLGTMTFGAQVDEADAAVMVDQCLDHGVGFIDTANVYNAGRAEEILGRILKRRRDRVVRGVEESLRRLQTDRLDLYYLHQPDPATPLEESLEAMDRLVRAGKVRYVGASNYAAWQVCRLLGLAEAGGWAAVAHAQPVGPRHRTRVPADVPDVWTLNGGLQPAGGRPAHRQAPGRGTHRRNSVRADARL
jgi:aryl-alcohol dehydrogenase-like predicted oxidoreductase